MKIGILGGRFDPPHRGHLEAALAALSLYHLDEVWLVPSNEGNLRRKTIATARERLAMLQLLIRGFNNLKISEVDIARGGVTYSIETIHDLKKLHPGIEFSFIIGEELVAELPKWKDWEKLQKETTFLPVKSKGFGGDGKIASSEIRERIKKGLPIKGMVPAEVEKYIGEQKLYQ